MNSIQFLTYRYKFLILYTIFGFISLTAELLLIRAIQSFDVSYSISAIFGFLAGLIIAFILNIRFNFHVAHTKWVKALLYFTSISLISFSIQIIFRQQLIRKGISIELSRFVISGIFFLLSYLLHRRFTFKEYKKVGVAIYADGVEDINKIYNRISNIADFIHIDIVDKTFNADCHDVKAYRAEVVRAYWQNKPIEVHIMSKTPTIWIKDLIPYVNTIYIHTNIDENIKEVLGVIKAAGCNPGIAVSPAENINDLYLNLSEIRHVLLLAIQNPGFSGQNFDMGILSWIKDFDKLKNRNDFTLCVDGGVNNTTIKYLNVDSVVSGSFVLNAEDPIKNILILQTSGDYE